MSSSVSWNGETSKFLNSSNNPNRVICNISLALDCEVFPSSYHFMTAATFSPYMNSSGVHFRTKNASCGISRLYFIVYETSLQKTVQWIFLVMELPPFSGHSSSFQSFFTVMPLKSPFYEGFERLCGSLNWFCRSGL